MIRYELKSMADRLAELLDSEIGSSAIPLMQQLLIASRESVVQDKVPASQNVGAEPIGIWQFEENGTESGFRRLESSAAYWRFWADIDFIPLRKSGRRVLLFGESVARGYFYDPYYTPADVLNRMLASTGTSAGSWEVVDLARVGIGLLDLQRLMRAGLQLSPDAIVVFAGNNWFHGLADIRLHDAVSSAAVASLLRSGGDLNGVRALIERDARAAVRNLLRECNGLSIPVFVIMPEFNLADWACVSRQRKVPWLAGGRSSDWLVARESAEIALERRDFNSAAEFANQMIHADGGLGGAGFDILGRCKMAASKIEEARTLFERARDAAILDPYASPRIYSLTQEVMRTECQRNNVELLDLPCLYKEQFPNCLPDRRLFLDYSHLTAEGIAIAMAASAAQILNRFGGDKIEWRSLLPFAPQVPGPVIGDAHLLAAVHNSHFGQDLEICFYHGLEALKHNPSLAKVMEDMLDAKMRNVPNRICASFERICNASKARNIYLISQTPATNLMHERDIRETVDELLIAEHAVGEGPTDLLESRFSLTSYNPLLREAAYYCALDVRSMFYLILKEIVAIEAVFTYRVPYLRDNGRDLVEFVVNGVRVDNLHAGTKWRTHVFHLPANLFQRGRNLITIVWPTSLVDGDAIILHQAARVEMGLRANFYPDFGEIQTFKVQLSK
jgi:hypothetical protein